MGWRWSVMIAGAALGLSGMAFVELLRAGQIGELRSQIASAGLRYDQLRVVAEEVGHYELLKVRLVERLQTARGLEAEQWSILGGVPARDGEEAQLDDRDARATEETPSRPSAVGWQQLTAALLAEPGLRRLELENGSLVATYTGTQERLGRLGNALLEDGRIRGFLTAQGGEAASLHAALEPGSFLEREP